MHFVYLLLGLFVSQGTTFRVEHCRHSLASSLRQFDFFLVYASILPLGVVLGRQFAPGEVDTTGCESECANWLELVRTHNRLLLSSSYRVNH